jgi:hypothetical protein
VVEEDGLQEVVVDVEDEVTLRGYLPDVFDDGVELLPGHGGAEGEALAAVVNDLSEGGDDSQLV